MRILHVKGSNLAWAPDAIAEATNRWTDHVAYVYQVYDDEKSDDVRHFVDQYSNGSVNPIALRGWDIVHFHNKPRLDTDIPSLILYHSEPGPRVDLTYDRGPKYVVAQYQMMLPEYADCTPMRNIINFVDNPLYDPIDIRDKIRVAYSPSILEAENKWYDKGARETIPILERLKAKYPDRFDFDLIHGVPLGECLARKRMCNIVIDECVTGSYHRSGLEGLAMDKLTITGPFSLDFERLLEVVAGAPSPPVFNEVHISNLEECLTAIMDAATLFDYPPYRRQWMEKHWHPRDIALQWVNEYRKVLG